MKYHIARGDEKLGEYNDLDVTGGLRRGEFLPTDLCWSAGMPGWEPLSSRFDVQPDEPNEPETDPFSALDGAPAAQFCQTITELLADPAALDATGAVGQLAS